MELDLKLLSKMNQERFWQNVYKTDHCWFWVGGTDDYGYGVFYIGLKQCRAHRLSWVMANQKALGPKTLICHTCDTPACVNPEHLWPGDWKANARDCMNKGRHIPPLIQKNKPVCKRGHKMIKENLYVGTHKSGGRKGMARRRCKPCSIITNAAIKKRIKLSKQVEKR